MADELLAVLIAANRRPAAGRPPDRRDHRAHHEPLCPDLLGKALYAIVIHLDVDVGVEQEQVHAIELDAIHLGLGRQAEHRIEVNTRFSARAAFANKARPHGVVELGVVAVTVFCAHKTVLSVVAF